MNKISYRIIFYGVVPILAAMLLYRQIQFMQIPAAQKNIPDLAGQDELPLPKRPGTQSIRIVGPPIKILKFEIDFKRNPQPIDWNFLEKTDKKADVTVKGEIDFEGNFVIRELRDKGHPRAGQYIQKILSSWKFAQYKMGAIKYYFNVPTKMERMKVQIDIRELERNPKFTRVNDTIRDGMIYFIDGLSRNNIMIIN